MKILFIIYKGFNKLQDYICDIINNLRFNCILWVSGAKVGKRVATRNGLTQLVIRRGAKIVIEDNVKFRCNHRTGWFANSYIYVGTKGKLNIAHNTGFNGAMIVCEDSITIGKYVNIGGGTRIYDTNFHNMDWEARRDPNLNDVAKTAPVVIEDDVFIGTGCIIGKGITIGARSIIAAGSVVVKDIPADCIAGGNPCKVIKYINNNE